MRTVIAVLAICFALPACASTRFIESLPLEGPGVKTDSDIGVKIRNRGPKKRGIGIKIKHDITQDA